MDSQFLDRVNTIRKTQGAEPLTEAELEQRRAKHLGVSNQPQPVNELDAFEAKARAAARKLKGGK
jgi:hypothetical protein